MEYVEKFVGKPSDPPTLSTAEPVRLIVPPTAERFAVNPRRSSVPDETERSPLIERLVVGDATPPDLFIVRLLNAVPPIDCAPLPLKVTVPVPALNVPVLVQSPPTAIDEVPPSSVVPALIVTPPATASGAFTANVPAFERVRFPDTFAGEESVAVPPALSNIDRKSTRLNSSH